METNKPTHAIDIAGNKVPIDYEYINYVATIKTALPIIIENKPFEALISLSDTMTAVSGMGHIDPKQHFINKTTYAQ